MSKMNTFGPLGTGATPALEDDCLALLPKLVLPESEDSGLESSEVRLFLFLPAGAGEMERERDLFLATPTPAGFGFLGFCSFALSLELLLPLAAVPPFLPRSLPAAGRLVKVVNGCRG